MSYKNKLIKMAFDNTPKMMFLWMANKKLKGVAELTDFNFDSDERKLYAQMVLEGEHEQDPVEVWLEDFTLVVDEDRSLLVVQQVRSSRPWVDALLTNIVLGREWKIPSKQKELIHELFSANIPEPQE